MTYPAGPRILAGLGALVTGAYFGVATPLLLRDDYPLTAAAMALSVVPLVVYLALLAAAPGALQGVLRRFTRIDLRDGGHVAASIIMAGTLWFVLGYGALASGLLAYESVVVQGQEAPAIDGNALFVNLTLNVMILVLPPFLYVAFVHGGGPSATLAKLGLGADGAVRALLIGFGAALLAIAALGVASAVVQQLEVGVPENERALEIARSVTVLGAFALAVGAAFSEEIFFRGFLQPRVGLLAQAVLFSIAHLSYVNVLQIVVTFALGLLFGLLYRHTRSLWAPIGAHFLFNLIMLVAGMYAPEAT